MLDILIPYGHVLYLLHSDVERGDIFLMGAPQEIVSVRGYGDRPLSKAFGGIKV